MERATRSGRPVRATLSAALAAGLAGVLAFSGSGQRPVTATTSTDAADASRADVVAQALEALRENAAVLGFASDGRGALGLGRAHAVTVTDVVNEPDGAAHVRMDRTYFGLPVLGGDFVVHRSPGGRWTGADATLYDPLRLGVDPVVTAEAAVEALRAASGRLAGSPAASGRLASSPAASGRLASSPAAPAPALVIHALGGNPRLAWDVFTTGLQADGQTPSRLHTYVDAVTGSVLSLDEEIHTATGEGRSLYAGTVKLDTSPLDNLFELRDPGRGGGYTSDAENRTDDCLPILLSVCTSQAPATVFTDKDNKWGSGTNSDRQTAAVDAQHGSDLTWDYFKSAHGRLGVANNKVGVYSRVHYGRSYGNAFWNDDCSCMTFGDGDGKELGPLVSIDIAAHEITHGLTTNTAKLGASGEAGGLNEATSDIFATMIEFSAKNAKDPGDYMVGEVPSLKKTGKDGHPNAIRFLDKPSRDGASPDCWTRSVRSMDIHLSAGIGDHLFYLLSEGSGKKTVNGVEYDSPTCNGGKVDGIGRDVAAKIWHRALTLHMTSDTDYAAARAATVKAATELFGAKGAQVAAVNAAWDAVNVEAGKSGRGDF